MSTVVADESRMTRTGKGIVLYDGGCPLCRKSVAILKRLDWLKRLACQDARDVSALPTTAKPLDPNRLMQEIHVVSPDHRVHAGFSAFRWIAGRLPLFWAVWPLLFLPGIPKLGAKAYRWIAKHRYHLVSCHDGQCRTGPTR